MWCLLLVESVTFSARKEIIFKTNLLTSLFLCRVFLLSPSSIKSPFEDTGGGISPEPHPGAWGRFTSTPSSVSCCNQVRWCFTVCYFLRTKRRNQCWTNQLLHVISKCRHNSLCVSVLPNIWVWEFSWYLLTWRTLSEDLTHTASRAQLYLLKSSAPHINDHEIQKSNSKWIK